MDVGRYNQRKPELRKRMNTIQEIQRINELELTSGIVNTPASWHKKYANAPWVYVGNISNQLTEGDILAVLSQWGEIEDINLVRDEGTGKSRGFAFLKYEDARSCTLAVDNFNGTKILGRPMRVDHVENYRLPKNLREKEDDDANGERGVSETSEVDAGPGHAYKDKELANDYDINQGHDLFAPVKDAKVIFSDEDGEVNGGQDTDKTSKQKRKEERALKRREKEARREAREEKRRMKRARKMVDMGNDMDQQDRDKKIRKRHTERGRHKSTGKGEDGHHQRKKQRRRRFDSDSS